MSKGLGHIESEILRLLPDAPHGRTDTVTLAALVYHIAFLPLREGALPNMVSKAEHSAVRRALASLKRKGLVAEHSKRRGRRHWQLSQ